MMLVELYELRQRLSMQLLSCRVGFAQFIALVYRCCCIAPLRYRRPRVACGTARCASAAAYQCSRC